MHRLHGYFDFLFFLFPPPTLSVGFLSPLTFFFYFLFLSGCWVAFGFFNFIVCTSNVWVGGASKTIVWFPDVCCINNCCNCFVSCSAGYVCAKPTIPSACGPTLCLVLSSIEHGASGKILYNKLD